jgi:tRNA(Ile)-lysidine synthase
MLLHKVKKTIDRFRMLGPSERVLVAVSGGPDSLALLHLLHALQDDLSISLTVAHLNHQLRGRESDADEEFVKQVAQGLGLKCLTRSVDVRQHAGMHQLSLEEAGRELRYAFLKDAAAATTSTRIAVGHTLNDQAETVLMRLVRGAGLAGLSAIYPVVRFSDALSLIRPLIDVSRQEVLQFLEEKSLAYRTDASNQDLRFVRNRIRAEVLPYLAEHFNAKVIQALARYAELAGEDEAFLSNLAETAAAHMLIRRSAEIHLTINELDKQPRALQRRILREALRQTTGSLRKVQFSHIESILQLTDPDMSGKRVQLPFGVSVRREFSELVFAPVAQAAAPFFYRLSIPGSIEVPEARCRIDATVVDRESMDFSLLDATSTTAIFDSRGLPAELIVRNRLPGDRYRTPGGGRKKVKELMIEKKIPRSQRDRIPVLAFPPDASDILWIPGFPVPKPYRPTPATDCYGLIKVIYYEE